jgi:preprotein translocase subunit SecF
MPSRSRNSRGKYTHQSRKSKAKQRQGLSAAKPETSAKSDQVVESVKPAEVRPATTAARAQTIVYPYVTGELKRIGILAAIIFVILIILAIVIH